MIPRCSGTWDFLSTSSKYARPWFAVRSSVLTTTVHNHTQVLVSSEVSGLLTLREMAKDSIRVSGPDHRCHQSKVG